METCNTKLKIYHKAIAKHYVLLLPICFCCSGPQRPLITKPAQLKLVEIHSLTHISSYFLIFMASQVDHSHPGPNHTSKISTQCSNSIYM